MQTLRQRAPRSHDVIRCFTKAHAAVPPIAWRVREPGFAGLIRQIVGQQVSVAAADAFRRRMTEGLGGMLTPEESRLKG